MAALGFSAHSAVIEALPQCWRQKCGDSKGGGNQVSRVHSKALSRGHHSDGALEVPRVSTALGLHIATHRRHILLHGEG